MLPSGWDCGPFVGNAQNLLAKGHEALVECTSSHSRPGGETVGALDTYVDDERRVLEEPRDKRMVDWQVLDNASFEAKFEGAK